MLQLHVVLVRTEVHEIFFFFLIAESFGLGLVLSLNLSLIVFHVVLDLAFLLFGVVQLLIGYEILRLPVLVMVFTSVERRCHLIRCFLVHPFITHSGLMVDLFWCEWLSEWRLFLKHLLRWDYLGHLKSLDA